MKSRLSPGNGAAVLPAATASLVQGTVGHRNGNFILDALQRGPALGVRARF